MVDLGLISDFFFHRFSLKIGVLVHPQSGLLWPASLPGSFLLLLNVTFVEHHYLLSFPMFFFSK